VVGKRDLLGLNVIALDEVHDALDTDLIHKALKIFVKIAE